MELCERCVLEERPNPRPAQTNWADWHRGGGRALMDGKGERVCMIHMMQLELFQARTAAARIPALEEALAKALEAEQS